MEPSQRKLLATTSLGHFVNDGTNFFVPVIAALLASGHGIVPLEITAMLAVYYASSSVLSLYVGRWADRSGKPLALMALGLALLGIGMGGFYVSLALLSGPSGFAGAVLASFLVGFGTSFYHPLGATLLQQGFERKELGVVLGVNGAMGSLGRAVYPILFFLVGLALTQNSALLVFAAAGLVSALTVGQRAPPASTPAEGTLSTTAPEVPRARTALTAGIVTLTVVAFVRSAANLGIVAFLPTYMEYVRPLWSGAPLGVEVTIMYVGGIVGQPIFGLLAGRVDTRALLGLSSLGSALATVGFLAFTGIPAIALIVLIGFFTFSAFPLLMSLSNEHVDRRAKSLANSMVFGLGMGIGGVLGPLVVGVLSSDRYSRLPLGFYAMAGLGIVAACAVLAIPSAKGKRSKVPLFG